MMSYKEANQILGSSLTPNHRCIAKRTALENDAQSEPLIPFRYNRLVPVSAVKKKTITFHIVLLDENGNVIPGYDMHIEQGAPIPYPEHPEKEGYKADGWEPNIPATAQSDGTYQIKYKQKDDDTPDGGREENAYTMDNQYQQYNPSKPTPTTTIAQWAPTGGHWWSGPMAGDGSDTYGTDNGISAKVVSGRSYVVLDSVKYFTGNYFTDSCVYEYARPTSESMLPSGHTVTESDLLSDWSCPCYDNNGNFIGNFTIHSDCDWVKFVIRKTSQRLDDLIPPFVVAYYVAENNGSVRKGTATVTTPGGTSNYNASHGNKGKPYITNAPTYFYQLGIND